MVKVTLTLEDEVVEGVDAVRLRVSHDITPDNADQSITGAMRAASFLIELYKNGGQRDVGEKEIILDGMEKIAAEAPAILDPFPGSSE